VTIKDSLHNEVEFWADMLELQDEKLTAEARDRMQMAKLLAERKLSLYTIDCESMTH
jgi:hypothetical protein